MSTNIESAGMQIRKVVFPTLWIFATLNSIYADVFTGFFDPAAEEVMTLPAGAVLGFAVLMETAIATVLLSRLLKSRVNRWANMIAGMLHTAAVSWSLFGDAPHREKVAIASEHIRKPSNRLQSTLLHCARRSSWTRT